MNLILEIVNTPNIDIFQKNMHFSASGGKIGRSQKATWTLNDPSKHISNIHAEVSFKNGQYYMTDISSNGMFLKSPRKQFVKGVPMPLNQKSRVLIGDYEIAVKTVEGTFMSNDPSLNVSKPVATTAGIPDTFFVGDTHKEAFGVIDSSAPEEKDIVSLLGGEHGVSTNDSMFLPELDSIMGAYESEESMVMNESLHTHIEPPTLNTLSSSSHEATPQVKNENHLLKILSVKLGLNLEEMGEKEQELFVSNLADMALSVVDQARQSQNTLKNIQIKLALSKTSNKSGLSLFNTVKESKDVFIDLTKSSSSIGQEISEIFQEVDKHNIAFYTAFKNISLKNAEAFSPNKLKFNFEKKNLLSKNFANKKALAWDAYCDAFQHLNDVNEEEIDLSVLQKEYNTILETLSYSATI